MPQGIVGGEGGVMLKGSVDGNGWRYAQRYF